MINGREVVLDILLEVLEKQAFSHVVIRQALEKYGYLSKQERAFISRLAQGCVERKIELDARINQVSSVKVQKMKPVIRNILRMTAYQLEYMDQIPDRAACDEAVRLAVKRGFSGLKGFVNGVCRGMIRNGAAFEQVKQESLSIQYSMPEWLIADWMRWFPEETVMQMLEGFYKERSISVRCNTSKQSKAQIIDSLKQDGVEVTQAAYVEDAILLNHYDRLDYLEAFRNGWIQVQDISSMLVGLAACPKEGNYCMDVCAAPGGKTIHLADQMNNTGVVDCRDVSMEKVMKIQENKLRCGFSNIVPTVADATKLDLNSIEKADILIADLPCSGLGILGKKADIKYQMTPEQMEELAKLQRQILSVVQQYVKLDGTLIYSTCTINPKENIENVRWFLEHYPYELVSLDDCFPLELHSETTKEGWIQLLPGIHDCDGFFIAKMKKVGKS
ncbi:Ribosomal RNA small subunit methyltransferase B [Clostridiales bacterium CHKCI001]|nr:Ribosomal RNA small subunit methyltransferase B [Clostridiales bacterium CHKCI001]